RGAADRSGRVEFRSTRRISVGRALRGAGDSGPSAAEFRVQRLLGIAHRVGVLGFGHPLPALVWRYLLGPAAYPPYVAERVADPAAAVAPRALCRLGARARAMRDSGGDGGVRVGHVYP